MQDTGSNLRLSLDMKPKIMVISPHYIKNVDLILFDLKFFWSSKQVLFCGI